MRILISNDDGVFAPGIRILAEELAKNAQIIVMAPDRNRSGASNSLSLSRPLRVKQLDNGHFSVEGTPTDCVHLALTGFIEQEIDLVVSGINNGANLGDDVLYSGTVAAAMEGRYLGLPAIAVSMSGENIENYETAAKIVSQLINRFHTSKLPSQTILNINVPDVALNKLKGIEVTRLGKRHVSAPTIKAEDPRHQPIYWIGPPGDASDAGQGTDFYAVNRGFASITPLHLDMTHYKIFEQLSIWMDDIHWDS